MLSTPHILAAASRLQSGIELLVAQNLEGEMNLHDSYVYDGKAGRYSRPEFLGDVSSTEQLYHIIPWVQHVEGEYVKFKPSKDIVRGGGGGGGACVYATACPHLSSLNSPLLSSVHSSTPHSTPHSIPHSAPLATPHSIL